MQLADELLDGIGKAAVANDLGAQVPGQVAQFVEGMGKQVDGVVDPLSGGSVLFYVQGIQL